MYLLPHHKEKSENTFLSMQVYQKKNKKLSLLSFIASAVCVCRCPAFEG